jgi:hypothetical protein
MGASYAWLSTGRNLVFELWENSRVKRDIIRNLFLHAAREVVNQEPVLVSQVSANITGRYYSNKSRLYATFVNACGEEIKVEEKKMDDDFSFDGNQYLLLARNTKRLKWLRDSLVNNMSPRYLRESLSEYIEKTKSFQSAYKLRALITLLQRPEFINWLEKQYSDTSNTNWLLWPSDSLDQFIDRMQDDSLSNEGLLMPNEMKDSISQQSDFSKETWFRLSALELMALGASQSYTDCILNILVQRKDYHRLRGRFFALLLDSSIMNLLSIIDDSNKNLADNLAFVVDHREELHELRKRDLLKCVTIPAGEQVFQTKLYGLVLGLRHFKKHGEYSSIKEWHWQWRLDPALLVACGAHFDFEHLLHLLKEFSWQNRYLEGGALLLQYPTYGELLYEVMCFGYKYRYSQKDPQTYLLEQKCPQVLIDFVLKGRALISQSAHPAGQKNSRDTFLYSIRFDYRDAHSELGAIQKQANNHSDFVRLIAKDGSLTLDDIAYCLKRIKAWIYPFFLEYIQSELKALIPDLHHFDQFLIQFDPEVRPFVATQFKTCLPSVYADYEQREKRMVQHHAAATKIQALFHGYMTRKTSRVVPKQAKKKEELELDFEEVSPAKNDRHITKQQLKKKNSEIPHLSKDRDRRGARNNRKYGLLLRHDANLKQGSTVAFFLNSENDQALQKGGVPTKKPVRQTDRLFFQQKGLEKRNLPEPDWVIVDQKNP